MSFERIKQLVKFLHRDAEQQPNLSITVDFSKMLRNTANCRECDLAFVNALDHYIRGETWAEDYSCRLRWRARIIRWVFVRRLNKRGPVRPPILQFKFHGNWCGPGHGGGEPTDSLDCLCKAHDECYEREYHEQQAIPIPRKF